MSIVSVANIHKTYGDDVHALRGVSFDVTEGSTFGLLGTNGAGKSTLIKMIVGHLRPDEGDLVVAGHDVTSSGKGIREFIGFLPEHIGFPAPLTGREILTFHAKMRSIPAQERDDRIDEILTTVGISDAADRRVGGYSNGMQRRLALGTALLPRPKILLLDEPTAGLDPLGVSNFHDIIQSLRKNTELTVIITSHVMGEIEKLCDSLVILHEGAVMAQGDMQDLFDRFDESSILSLTFRANADVEHAKTVIADAYGAIESRHGRTLDVRVPRRNIPDIFKELDGGTHIEEYSIQDNDLEQIFKQAIAEPTETDGGRVTSR